MPKFTLLFILHNYLCASQTIHFNTESQIDAKIEEFFHDAELQVNQTLLHDICQKASTAVAHLKK
jgi:hypothetical protein